ncbi:hypothetical protein ABC766_00055 [Methylobacterium fujisawaense]|jgi:hypothetical protein|uniref:hypothetical protein n=1 Tax=Methylobacterium fujisawaense TaxID=107400 RepID=UPI0031F4E298
MKALPDQDQASRGAESTGRAPSGPGSHPSDQTASRSGGQAVSIPRAGGKTKPVRLYEVTARLYGQAYTKPVSARSPAAARYRAYLDADLDMPFRDYQRFATVRLAPGIPPDDGYGYIRRSYGIDPQIGRRITLTGEGKDWEGREGEIVYPGTSRNYGYATLKGDLGSERARLQVGF